MVKVLRLIPLLGVLALFAVWTGSAAAAPHRTAAAAPAAAFASWVPGEHSLRAPEQAADEQSTEQSAAEESSSERTAWAIAAVVIFLGITAIGFVVAVYGYSAGR